MAIDLGDIPTGTPPTAGEKLQIRSAIGVGTTDAPTFLALSAGTGTTKFEYTAANGISLNTADQGTKMLYAPAGFLFYGSGVINFFLGQDGSGNGVASMSNLGYIGFASAYGPTFSNSDVRLFRDAAGILAQRNGVNAQAFRVYDTYDTAGTNYERGTFGFPIGTNTLRIGTEQAGTGVAQPIEFVTGGVARWQISAAGHFLAATDATYDIGAATTNRPANINASSSIRGEYLSMTSGVAGVTRSYLVSPSTGVVTIYNAAGSDFSRLQLGGTTSAFPAIKRNGTAINIVLADDSAFAPLAASTIDAPFITSSTSLAITAGAGGAGISIGCSRFRINGNTSSFPAFKNVGTRLDFILADDTGFTGIQSLYQRFGTNTPEGSVTAPIGAVYHRTDGGAGTSFYVKESTTGNTGWVGK